MSRAKRGRIVPAESPGQLEPDGTVGNRSDQPYYMKGCSTVFVTDPAGRRSRAEAWDYATATALARHAIEMNQR